MNKLQIATSALIALTFSNAHAIDKAKLARPMITVSGAPAQINLTPSDTEPSMTVEMFGDKVYTIRALGKNIAPVEKWTSYSFAFTPETSGDVILTLQSQSTGDKDIELQVDYDNLSSDGTTIPNADFEERELDKSLKNWKVSGEPIPNSKETASSGDNYVTASNKNKISCPISVKGGELVRITFRARTHSDE
jgi:hypothetical protein